MQRSTCIMHPGTQDSSAGRRAAASCAPASLRAVSLYSCRTCRGLHPGLQLLPPRHFYLTWKLFGAGCDSSRLPAAEHTWVGPACLAADPLESTMNSIDLMATSMHDFWGFSLAIMGAASGCQVTLGGGRGSFRSGPHAASSGTPYCVNQVPNSVSRSLLLSVAAPGSLCFRRPEP